MAFLAVLAPLALGQQPLPVDVVVPNETKTAGTWLYQAVNSVTADAGFTVGDSASVTFSAGTQIHLGPGFHATAGSAATTFRAVVGPQVFPVTVTSAPPGLALTVDGAPCTTPCTYQWAAGSAHTVAASSPQAGNPGTRYVFANWSDGGAASHSVAVSYATYTAYFNTEHQLTTTANPPDAGAISPASGWRPEGTYLIYASSYPPAMFQSFSGDLTGTTVPGTLLLNGPKTVIANFTGQGAVATPIFSPPGGTYSTAQSVTLSSTPDASIYYTLNGPDPDPPAVGTLYTAPIQISSTTTIRAIAQKSGMSDSIIGWATYTISTQVAAPTFTPPGGSYSSSQSVTLNSTTPGASIRYTTDGSTPSSTQGTLYSTPVNVASNITIRAIAYKAGMTDSDVSLAAYTITPGVVASPVFSPAAGSYGEAQSVTLSSSTSGASIRYTTDGSTPTSAYGELYTGSISVSETTTIKAIAYKAGMTDSDVVQATYTITAGLVSAPAFSPPGGSYIGTQSVTLSSSTSGASIRYTTDGSTPTSAYGELYTGSISVSETTTIKAIAYKADMTDSDVVQATYTIGSWSDPANPAKEYIRLGGRTIAIENRNP